MTFHSNSHSIQINVSEFLISINGDVEKLFEVSQNGGIKQAPPNLNKNVFDALVPPGIKPGDLIVITATPFGQPDNKFVINFHNQNETRLLLHLTISLHHHFIYFDSMNETGHWIKQICSKHQVPITINQIFKIGIAMMPNEFQIAINGKNYLKIPFRESPDEIYEELYPFEIYTEEKLIVKFQGVDHI